MKLVKPDPLGDWIEFIGDWMVYRLRGPCAMCGDDTEIAIAAPPEAEMPPLAAPICAECVKNEGI